MAKKKTPPKSKKNPLRALLDLIGGVLVFICGLSALCSMVGRSPSTPKPTATLTPQRANQTRQFTLSNTSSLSNGSFEWTIEKFEARTKAGQRTAEAGMAYLVVYGTVRNISSQSSKSLNGSQIAVHIENQTYKADGGVMAALQSDLNMDYIGTILGVTIEKSKPRSLYVAFEVVESWDHLDISLDNHTVGFTVNNQAQSASATSTPVITSAPITTQVKAAATQTTKPTQRPLPTKTVVSVTYYIKQDANLRSCAKTDNKECPIIQTAAYGQAITILGEAKGTSVGGSTLWYGVSWGGKTLYVHASLVSKTQPSSPVNPVVVENPSASSNTGTNTSAIQPSTSVPENNIFSTSDDTSSAVQPTFTTSSITASGGNGIVGARSEVCSTFDYSICQNYRTPSSCEQVREWGIPSRDASCCFPARDRDNDGEACYED